MVGSGSQAETARVLRTVLTRTISLAVARSLLAESNGPVASVLGQDARGCTLADIQAE
jgi:hypothetical protein